MKHLPLAIYFSMLCWILGRIEDCRWTDFMALAVMTVCARWDSKIGGSKDH